MLVSDRRTEERGAMAVIFTLLIVVLLGMGALAIDFGNLVTRRTATQTQADFAAFAGASKMEDAGLTGATPPAVVVDAVRDSLNANQPRDDADPCWRDSPVTCVTSADLTDGQTANGEVRFTELGLQVVSPRAWVGFGLAKALGSDGAFVSSAATVRLFSPGRGVMPLYGVSGCDYGRQVLSDPAGGQVVSTTPTIAYATDTNSTDPAASRSATPAAPRSTASLSARPATS